MTDPRPPKKSETLEIRIPYPTKTDFMEMARAEGRAASEIVRERIDAPSGVSTDVGDPLMIVVDLPEGGLTAAELGELVGKAFARLDKDGNGLLLSGE